MASGESQECNVLRDDFYDDPSQLSQILRQRAGSGRALQFTASPERHCPANTSSTSPSGKPVTKEPHRDGAQPPRVPAPRRVRIALSHVKPSLPRYHTAPTSTGYEKEIGAAAKMFQTFHGPADEPGDTQPDSQMFRQFTSGVLDSGSHLAPTTKPFNVAQEEGEDSPTDQIEADPLGQEQQSPTITSPTVIHGDLETQLRMDPPLTSPLKFETPALMGKKRNNQGQVLSSAAKTNTTPGTVLSASAFFGFGDGLNGNGISLTQAFNATQAKTSPAVDGPSEDPVFQRPSPNFTNARQSSPAQPMSSPVRVARKSSPVLRSSSEPRADYETMKQSQERRKQRAPEKYISPEAQDSWEGPTPAMKRVEKRKARERLEYQAARSLSGVTAPLPAATRPAARRGRKRDLVSMTSRYSSPVKVKVYERAIRANSREIGDDNSSPDELSEPLLVNGVEDDESPDELSQDIVPSSARTSRALATAVKSSGANKVQVPNTSSHPQRTSGQSVRNRIRSASPSLQIQRKSQFRAPASQPLHRGVTKLRSSRESEVIMDSQPDANAEPGSTPRPLHFPFSLSSNQYSINQTTMKTRTGFTSQLVSSSMPPMPPSSSSPAPGIIEEEEERVPSSPPIVAPDDIVYDEHNYDEHSDIVREEEASQPDEDVTMQDEDEDGLPEGEACKDEDLKDGGLADRDNAAADSIECDVHMRNDAEVPETIEREESPGLHNEEDELIRYSHPEDDGHYAETRARRQNTVPETDALEETQPSFFPETVNGSPADSNMPESAAGDNNPPEHTNSTEPFHTAKEQQSTAHSSKLTDDLARGNETEPFSDAPKVRSLLDIANQPSTQYSGDLDAIEMPQLSFAADASEDFEELKSGPSPVRPSKKRKVTYSSKKKAFRSPVKDTDPLYDNLSSPFKRVHPAERPALANEHGDKGTRAAEQVRQDVVVAQPATLRSRKVLKSTMPQTPRKGALKSVNKALLTTSPYKSPPKPPSSKDIATFSPPALFTEIDIQQNPGMEKDDAEQGASEEDELAGPTPLPDEARHNLATTVDDGELSTGELLVPNRVLAMWPGGQYYPATCLSRADGGRLRVRYDDGNVTSLDAAHVRALDLRHGDQVKVDEKGMKKPIYVVVGFKDKIGVNAGDDYPLTDRHGYATVILEEKQRESLSTLEVKPNSAHIAVPIGSIYLTASLWSRIRDRSFRFSPPCHPSAPVSRVGTPAAMDALATPAFPRRSTAGPSHLRDSMTRAASVASSIRPEGTVFANMAFAVTFTNASTESSKKAITKLIKSHGGQILENGFQELFELELSDAPASSEGTAKVVSGLDGLLLKREHKDLGFVALISDSHSRRTKHFQALALNTPVLHHRWISDSVAASRPLPFAPYLLPAGLSTYLEPEGVVRSRTMQTYDPAAEDVSFLQMIKQRDLLLHGQSVLVVTGPSTEKKDVEKKDAFIFLTQALGPADVARCKSAAMAKKLLKEGDWDWVLVDDGEARKSTADADGSRKKVSPARAAAVLQANVVAEAAAALFGHGEKGEKERGGRRKSGAKKRKRKEEEEGEALVRVGTVGGRKVRVACDEFVIQSLILGALVDE